MRGEALGKAESALDRWSVLLRRPQLASARRKEEEAGDRRSASRACARAKTSERVWWQYSGGAQEGFWRVEVVVVRVMMRVLATHSRNERGSPRERVAASGAHMHMQWSS